MLLSSIAENNLKLIEKGDKIITEELFYRYVKWLIFNIVGTLIARYSTIKIPLGKLSENSWWKRIFILQYDQQTGIYYFQITGSTFYGGRRFLHYQKLIIMYSLVFFYGNAYQKYFNDWKSDILHAIICYTMIILYGCLESVKGMNISLTPKDWPKFTLQFEAWLLFVLIATISLFVHHVNLAIAQDILGEYIFSIMTVIICYLYSYFYIVKLEPEPIWHIHHWFIGLFLSFCWRFDDFYSKLAFSFYYGVFLEGSSDSMGPIIYNDDDR